MALVASLSTIYLLAAALGLLRARRFARAVVGLGMELPLRILGMRVTTPDGEKLGARQPAIVVAPHYSWLDPMVLAQALGGKVRFVATKEIENWPFFGFLVNLHGTIFIDRTKRSAVLSQKDQIEAALREGFSVAFFPEGASGNGNRVRRFKSALFSVAMETGLKIQPISIAYTKLDGIPMLRILRPLYAWYGDVDLLTHLKRMLGGGRAEVTVAAGDLLDPRKFGDRKQLALAAEKQITQKVAAMLMAAP